MWTPETRVEVTLPGYTPTLRGRRAVAPLLAARDTFIGTDDDAFAIDYPEAPRAPFVRCPTRLYGDPDCTECRGTGEVPTGHGGNMEQMTSCPACTPDAN